MFRFQYHLYFFTQCSAQKFIILSASFHSWPIQVQPLRCRAVEGAIPYTFVSTVCPPQNRCRSLRILLCIRNYKSGAEICSPIPLCFGLQLCTFSFIILHRLVGLRLLRLCLKLRQGFAHFLWAKSNKKFTYKGFHPLTLTRGVPLDLLLASLGASFTLYL